MHAETLRPAACLRTNRMKTRTWWLLLCPLLVFLPACALNDGRQPTAAGSQRTTPPQRVAAPRQACESGWYWDSEAGRCRPITSTSAGATQPRATKPTDERPACPFGMYWSSKARTCLPISEWAQPREIEPRVPRPAEPSPSRKETPRPTKVVGTAFGVAPDGLLLTAFHLVSDARLIRIVCSGVSEMDGRVLRASPALDLALVRVAGQVPGYLRLANTRSLQIGDPVFTVGFPVPHILGRDPKFTDGVVSALTAVGREDALFQMTVPVQPGNSGGAVLNNDGRVVGVVVSTAAVEAFLAGAGTLPQNINWAVKADYAIPLFEAPAGEAQPKSRREAIEHALRATCMLEAER